MARKWIIGGFGAALLLVVGLALLPQTGWLVRAQLSAATGKPLVSFSDTGVREERNTATLRAHPDDYLVQLAGALQGTPRATVEQDQVVINSTLSEKDRAAQLAALEPRFGSHASLYAHQLRYLTFGSLQLRRVKEQVQIEVPNSVGDRYGKNDNQKPAPEDVARFIALANRGAALDPQNGFFPTMLALGYFADHQDVLAHQALHFAAQKPFWNDYAMEEASARLRLITRTHGEVGSVARMAVTAAVLLPHFSQVRAMARLATAQAMAKEEQGDTAAGLQIRRDVSQLGASIRTTSTVTIARLVGVAVTAIASSRPGGAPAMGPEQVPDGSELIEKRVAAYTTYLKSIGADAEARWYAAEHANALTMRKNITRSIENYEINVLPIYEVMLHWGGGFVLLWNTFWAILLGGLATLLARNERIRVGKPLWAAVGWGFATLLLAPLMVVALHLLATGTITSLDSGLTALACGTALLIPLIALKRGVTGREYGTRVGGFALTILGVTLLLTGMGFSLMPFFQSFGDSITLASSFGSDPENGSPEATGLKLRFALLASLLGVLPLLILAVLPLWSRLRRNRIPVSVGVVLGMRRLALPLATLFLLGYGISLILTARLEADCIRRVDSIIQDEAAFITKQSNLALPGATPR
ncbi:MAG: hypothetical protein OHK0029_14290 [Armatimonadaceae bacterium]